MPLIMRNNWLVVAGVCGLLAVGLGAMAAHALEASLSAENLARFDTAARYHLIHSVALLAISLRSTHRSSRAVAFACWAFLAGILLFSGSLYIYAVTEVRVFAHITPIGGLSFMAGWIALSFAGLRKTVASRVASSQ